MNNGNEPASPPPFRALRVSEVQLDALRAQRAEQISERFVDWTRRFPGIAGLFSTTQLRNALAEAEVEARQSGIDSESRRFLYTISRMLIPTMDARQYILCMDVIFGRDSEPDKLNAILRLRGDADA